MEHENQNKRIAELERALAFAASVIKSGEAWSDECEKLIGDVLADKSQQPPPTAVRAVLLRVSDLKRSLDEWQGSGNPRVLVDVNGQWHSVVAPGIIETGKHRDAVEITHIAG